MVKHIRDTKTGRYAGSIGDGKTKIPTPQKTPTIKNKQVGIAGDWHINALWAEKRLQNFADKNVKTIYHLGDFGVDASDQGENYLKRVNAALEKHGQKLYVTLGNHENYEIVAGYKTLQEGPDKGWLVDPTNPNILYATRGQRWELEGVSFVSLGGASSINRYDLHEGIDWFSGEQISYGDIMNTLNGGHAEIFLAHDVPEGVNLYDGHSHADSKWTKQALEYAARSRKDLRVAVDGVKPEIAFAGHYHHNIDQTVELEDGDGTKYQVRSVVLNKDNEPGNLAILNLPSKKVEILTYDIND